MFQNNFTKYFNSKEKYSYFNFANSLSKYMKNTILPNQKIVIVCIGTDRATGDSLGPLVGYKLINSSIKKYDIYGTLENPVHAKNLSLTVSEIYKKYINPFLIVIDASLGKYDHIGFVTLSNTALKPGKGVNKNLPELGNISITGIVNIADISTSALLQSTRLNTVMLLADYISNGLKLALFDKSFY